VLETACGQSAEWRAAGRSGRPLDVSVNLSARQFLQHDLEETVVLALDAAGIEPSSLRLEITESVLLQSSREAGETVTRLAGRGVRVVLDDFGTGYSSLAYLSGLAIDGLKVDRTFVEKLGVDERSTAITTAIIRMAQALSVEVIAEGVENTRQVDALRNLECELAQGFHFHPPLPPEAIAELLGGGPTVESASRWRTPAARDR
jgi:EAL domain-containing protein (putative c-di-GMP-specific phosphodiesterase class I)